MDIRATPTENVRAIAAALGRKVGDITVVILERPRHETLIAEVRAAGARIKLISDGDLSAAISCAVSGTGVHAVMGIGGAPEGVITAAALRCLGGEIQARFRYRSDDERERGERMGHGDEDRVYRTEDLAPGENLVFAATGVTAGDLLEGVRFFGGGARTHSLVMAYQTEAGPVRRHRPHVRSRQAPERAALTGPSPAADGGAARSPAAPTPAPGTSLRSADAARHHRLRPHRRRGSPRSARRPGSASTPRWRSRSGSRSAPITPPRALLRPGAAHRRRAWPCARASPCSARG